MSKVSEIVKAGKQKAKCQDSAVHLAFPRHSVGERGRRELVAPVASGSINTPIGEWQKFQLLLTLQIGHFTCYQAW